jgi:hypothetical protein
MNCGMKPLFVVFFVLVLLPLASEWNLQECEVRPPIGNLILSDIEFGSLSEGEADIYNFVVLNSATRFQLSLTGPDGADFDLYVRINQQPSTSTYDYSATGSSPDETITVNSPSAGVWYVMVFAYSGSGSYSLTLDVDYPDPDPEPTSSPPPSTSSPPPTTSSPSGSTTTPLSLDDLEGMLIGSLIISGMILGVIALLWITISNRRKQAN